MPRAYGEEELRGDEDAILGAGAEHLAAIVPAGEEIAMEVDGGLGRAGGAGGVEPEGHGVRAHGGGLEAGAGRRQQRLGIEHGGRPGDARPPRARAPPARDRRRGRRRRSRPAARRASAAASRVLSGTATAPARRAPKKSGGPGETIGEQKGHAIARRHAAGPQSRPRALDQSEQLRVARRARGRHQRAARSPPFLHRGVEEGDGRVGERRRRHSGFAGAPRGRRTRTPFSTRRSPMPWNLWRPSAWNCHSASRLGKPAR